MTGSGLYVSGLAVSVGRRRVVEDVSFTADVGEVVALCGPSGIGKTLSVLAALGCCPPGTSRLTGTVTWNGKPVPGRRWRCRKVGYLGQNPASTMPTHRKTIDVISEANGSRTRSREELENVGLDPKIFAERKVGSLSGGQAQRVALARALAGNPQLLVLDEPTSALDRRSWNVAVERICQLRRRAETAIVLISHNPEAVEELADKVVELGGHPLSKPAARNPTSCPEAGQQLVLVERLLVRRGGHASVAVERLELRGGEMVAVTGSSGVGKSTLLLAIAGLLSPQSGQLRLYEKVASWALDDRPEMPSMGWAGQSPRGELNPAHRVRTMLRRQMPDVNGVSRKAVDGQITGCLESLGLSSEIADRRAAELSGGQRQRVVLARALLARPAVLLADEVTSALDYDMTNASLDVLDDFRRSEDRPGVLVATHDPLVIDRADRIVSLDLKQTEEKPI